MLDCDSLTEEQHTTMTDKNPQSIDENTVLVSDPGFVSDQNQETRVSNSFEETPASDPVNPSPFWRSEIRVSDDSEIEVLRSFSMNTDTIEEEETKFPDQERKNHCSISQKVDTLFNKIKDLKKGHMVLSNEVKAVNGDQFLGSGVVAALGHLGSEHETLRSEHETLRRKYVDEISERKRLYNEVIELKGNIRVFCRCRPLNSGEMANGTSSVVEVDSSRETELQIVCSDSTKKQFKFDHVFGSEDNQEAVFAQTSPVVISVLDGFNVCIFAYGQTGTGKTFTMEGVPGNRGVNYRTLEELFRISKERCITMKYELFVSMLEVYNEKIRDLLIENSTQPSKKLEIKQVAEGTLEIPGLVEARVYSTDEVWELLKMGARNRAVGSTNANELSSRSHCLFRVTVKGENLVNGQKTRSHLWLVDLAGSERVGRIDVDGERLKESQFINKSLSALGDVISALASKTPHIPYRNSKLTHLLQSSLGGDCKALMFVQISPSAEDLGETLCSLNFASRVRGIEHGPARKQADPTEHFKFKQMVEKLKQEEKERKKLQETLQQLQLKFAARDQLCRAQQEKMRDLENQLAEERKARLQQEARTSVAAAAKPSLLSSLQSQKLQNVKKPPLGPSRPREPLRRITNFLPPPPSPLPVRKLGTALPNSAPQVENENDPGASTRTNNKVLMRPRRVSIAVHRPTEATQANQPRPKRQRVSIATLRPDSQLLSAMNQGNTSTVQMQSGGTMARRLFANDPRRKSRIFSPLPELTTSGPAVEATPVGASKFMRSPRRQPQVVGSWKPKHPTAVALQRRLASCEESAEATPTVCKSKFMGGSPEQQQGDAWKLKQPMALALQRRPVVWSPLQQKIQKKERKSLPPSRLGQNGWQ